MSAVDLAVQILCLHSIAFLCPAWISKDLSWCITLAYKQSKTPQAAVCLFASFCLSTLFHGAYSEFFRYNLSSFTSTPKHQLCPLKGFLHLLGWAPVLLSPSSLYLSASVLPLPDILDIMYGCVFLPSL